MTTPSKTDLAAEVRALLAADPRTVAQIAKKAGLSRSQAYRIAQGGSTRLNTLQALLRVLNARLSVSGGAEGPTLPR